MMPRSCAYSSASAICPAIGSASWKGHRTLPNRLGQHGPSTSSFASERNTLGPPAGQTASQTPKDRSQVAGARCIVAGLMVPAVVLRRARCPIIWHFCRDTLECKGPPLQRSLLRPGSITLAEASPLPEHHAAASPSTPIAPRDPRLHSQIDAMVTGRHSDPFSFLGPHPVDGGWAVRFFLPWAEEARISFETRPSENAPASNKVVEAVKLRPEGFFEAVLPTGDTSPPPPGIYRIQIRTHYGETFELYDPYAFPCVLTEFDLYLMGEGRHYDTYQKLGARLIRHLGNLHSRTGRRRHLQIGNHRACRKHASPESRSLRFPL